MKYPVPEKYKVTQGFGKTEYANLKGEEIYYFFEGQHPGLDFAMPEGEPVFAHLSGFVTSVEFHRGMGKVIRIRSGNIQHIYGHLAKFNIEIGDYVEEGKTIAFSGATVHWSGPHLHFELRDLTVYEVNERPFEPQFGKGLPRQFKSEFIYEANHEQAIIDLAIKFFGSDKGVDIITSVNPELSQLSSYEVLVKGTKVLIPYR